MSEFDEFAEALIGQLSVEIDEEKVIVELTKKIKEDRSFTVEFDGYQDCSIKKDLKILCFNEKQLIGNGHTIPSGPLRENLSSIKKT